jgi:hypothetical protein
MYVLEVSLHFAADAAAYELNTVDGMLVSFVLLRGARNAVFIGSI